MMNRRKTLIIMCSFFVLGVALFLLRLFTIDDSAESFFRWISDSPEYHIVQVATGKKVVAPFEVKIGANIKEVSFDIKEESLQKSGVSIEGAVVQVRDSIASSQVIFNFRPEAGIKAGHDYLTIVARDTSTGSIIREGEMPFAVDILDLIWKCSC